MGASFVPGSVIAGRYRLDRLLGQGGMGAVWAATHTITRRAVAIKLLRGPAHERAELRRRFLREARAASAVNHPNVVQVHDVFEHDADTPVMVMDLLTGETLGQRIARDESLSLRETASLLAAVVSAVGTGHARGVVHRDLKPENIFLVEDDGDTIVKVLDFGVAKLFARDGRPIEPGLTTQAGLVVGTPCYMAPEQALGDKRIDHRADIWALGVILYECLSGARPLEGETVGQLVMNLMSSGIVPLERVALRLPEEITGLVGRMLSREPSRRPDDLREVHEILSRHTDVITPSFGPPGTEASEELGSDSTSDSDAKPVVDAPTTPEPRRGWTGGGIAAVVIALAGAAIAAVSWTNGAPAEHPLVPPPPATTSERSPESSARPPEPPLTVVTASSAEARPEKRSVAALQPAPRISPPSASTAEPVVPAPASSAPRPSPTEAAWDGGIAEKPPY